MTFATAAILAAAFVFKPGEWSVSGDGRSIRNLRAEGVFSFSIGETPAFDDGCVLSFEARMRKDPAIDRDGHFGFDFVNARSEKGKLFTRGEGTILILRSPGGKPVVSGSRKGAGRVGSNEWARIRVKSSPHMLAATVDGELCTCLPHPMTPLRKLSFYTCNRFVELRDIALEPLRETPSAGGVMFWAKFVPGSDMVELVDGAGTARARFYCHGDTRIQADVMLDGVPRPVIFKRRLFEETVRACDDFHCAFTWRTDGSARFFLNGLPFTVGLLGHEEYDKDISGNMLAGTTAKATAPKRTWRGWTQHVSGLESSPRPYSNCEVMAAYRRRMPVDIQFLDSVVAADVQTNAVVTVAPGGTFVSPSPMSVVAAPVKATVDVSLAVERIVETKRADGGTDRRFEPVPEAGRVHAGVCVDAPVELHTGRTALKRGRYRLLATVAAPGCEPCSRTLFFSALPDVAPSAATPVKAEWKKSALVWARAFRAPGDMEYGDDAADAAQSGAGAYLEIGSKGGLDGARKACVVDFPADAIGHPCLLEIDWPDDKPRLMGFYMYLDSPKQAQHRDRLQGGIAAGGVLPSTGKMQRTSYLFFPSSTNHLFEIRTLAANRPAAIASLKVWRLEEPLPILKIHRPKGLPHRRFGHMDEDQTFYMMLNDVAGDGLLDTKTRELFRYFAYTGQDAFQYSIFRYTDSLGSNEGRHHFCGYGGAPGELPWIWRNFAANGIAFTGEFFMFTTPQMARFRQIDSTWRARGLCMLDDEGYDVNSRLFSGIMGVHAGNFSHPKVRRLYFESLAGLLGQAGRCGMREFEVPVATDKLFGTWPSLRDGYDDWNWNLFRKEGALDAAARAHLAQMPARAALPADFTARHAALTAAPLRDAWLRWRADKVTEFFASLAAFIRTRVPEATIYLTLSECKGGYAEHGIDLEALARVPGTVPALERDYTKYWWNMFHPGRTADDAAYRAMYDPEAPAAKAIRASSPCAALFRSAAAYFETFRPSAANARFKSYFQNADVKPWGRHFLREPAFAVGALDALRYCVGNEPIGTLGREAETREFAQAYGALPALPFRDVAGSDMAAVVCRRRKTAEGTYFYLVNMTAEDRTADVSYADAIPETLDLSTERKGRWTRFTLRPYELRSFLSDGAVPVGVRAQ